MVEDYKHLWIPEDMRLALEINPKLITNNCDGVGSSSTWMYYLIPNYVWFLNVKLAANVHDWMYTFPMKFASYLDGLDYKNKADLTFYNNMIRLFELAEQKSWIARRLAKLRRMQAMFYFKLVQNYGEKYFWNYKIIEGNFK